MRRSIIIAVIFCFSIHLSAEPIPMVCTWKLWFEDILEKDTFIFDLNAKTVYWVDEDKTLKLNRITDGLIKFKGIPFSRVQIDETKYKTHIPINFTLNRITGGLKVESKYGKTNHDSKCIIKPPLL